MTLTEKPVEKTLAKIMDDSKGGIWRKRSCKRYYVFVLSSVLNKWLLPYCINGTAQTVSIDNMWLKRAPEVPLNAQISQKQQPHGNVQAMQHEYFITKYLFRTAFSTTP